MTINILCIGNCDIGSNALSLFKGFSNIGAHVRCVNTSFLENRPRISLSRIVRKFAPSTYAKLAALILSSKVKRDMKHFNPDLVVVFKGIFVNRKLLETFKVLKVHYHPDDSTNPANRTIVFDEAEGTYDIHFTSKKHNLREIYERVNKPVYFFWYAYDPDWHFQSSPLDFADSKYRIGFIGNYRPDRVGIVNEIAQRFGREFGIAGIRWEKVPGLAMKISILGGIYGADFSKFIETAPIQLGLLNSDNRDSHTARSFEVPAAGGLLIAEDTEDHREIFQSEENVLFFRDKSELLAKIKWAIENPSIAENIASNGHRLITEASNTWADRASFMLEMSYK